MFFEDAQVASRELELTLTGRDCGEEQRAPMCAAFRIIPPKDISESLSRRDIRSQYASRRRIPHLQKGLVKREVIRVVTPRHAYRIDAPFPETRNNYLAALYSDDGSFGICFCDISTAYMTSTVITGADAETPCKRALDVYAEGDNLECTVRGYRSRFKMACREGRPGALLSASG